MLVNSLFSLKTVKISSKPVCSSECCGVPQFAVFIPIDRSIHAYFVMFISRQTSPVRICSIQVPYRKCFLVLPRFSHLFSSHVIRNETKSFC